VLLVSVSKWTRY